MTTIAISLQTKICFSIVLYPSNMVEGEIYKKFEQNYNFLIISVTSFSSKTPSDIACS